VPIMITPVQVAALETHQLNAFAAEVARTLDPILAGQPPAVRRNVTEAFARQQIERARVLGLKRRNEMMAWTLCALVHGADFEWRIAEVHQIVAERNYDRSMLLTLLAMNGLGAGKGAA